jgi:DNA-3-methyladenine glycosylase
VYLIYGIHHCMNIVTGPDGHASAVLLRAVEPVANLAGRGSGPGLLCRALRINRGDNGRDLLGSGIYIAKPVSAEEFSIAKRPRVGVDYAGIWAKRLLRFYIRGNEFVSRR